MVSELEVGDGMGCRVLEPPAPVVSYLATPPPKTANPGACQFSTSGLKCQMSGVQRDAEGRKTSSMRRIMVSIMIIIIIIIHQVEESSLPATA